MVLNYKTLEKIILCYCVLLFVGHNDPLGVNPALVLHILSLVILTTFLVEVCSKFHFYVCFFSEINTHMLGHRCYY